MADGFDDLPAVEAGAPMPTGHSILLGDLAARQAAQAGSAALLARILAYYETHHRRARVAQ